MSKSKTKNSDNDAKTTVGQLRNLCNDFRTARGWNQADAATFAKDIAVEAGELLNHFVWEETVYLQDADIAQEVRHELVDVLFGVLIMSKLLNVDLTKTLKEKLEILNKKYPVKDCVKRNGNDDVEWRRWANQRKKMFKSK